jgi:hypothetical protein
MEAVITGLLYFSGKLLALPWVGCPRNSVDTEFRLVFLLPSISYSVRNWLKIPPNSAESRVVEFREIPRNFTEFRDFFHVRYSAYLYWYWIGTFYVLLYVCRLTFFPFLSGYTLPREANLLNYGVSEKMKRNAKLQNWGKGEYYMEALMSCSRQRYILYI